RIVDQFTLKKASPESIVLDRTEVSLAAGSSVKVNATVLPTHAYNKTVTWSVYKAGSEANHHPAIQSVVESVYQSVNEAVYKPENKIGHRPVMQPANESSADHVVTVSADGV